MRLLVQFANPNTLWPGRLGFPSAVVQRATPLVRWALLILATRFASPFDRVRTLAAGYSGTLRGAPAMPGDAMAPDEPPTWAGEQHRRCRARVDREGRGRGRRSGWSPLSAIHLRFSTSETSCRRDSMNHGTEPIYQPIPDAQVPMERRSPPPQPPSK